MGVVEFPNGLEQDDAISLADKIMLADGTDGKIRYANLQQIKTLLIAILTGQIIPTIVQPGDVLGAPTDVAIRYGRAGTYTLPTGPRVLAQNLNMFIWDKVAWGIIEIPITVDLTPYVSKANDIGRVTSKNLFSSAYVLATSEYNIVSHTVQARADDEVFRFPCLANSIHSISGLPSATVFPRSGAFITASNVLIAGTEFTLQATVSYKDNLVTPNQDCFFVISLKGRTAANSDYSKVLFESSAIHTEYDANYTGAISIAGMPFLAPLNPTRYYEPVSLFYLKSVFNTKTTRNIIDKGIITVGKEWSNTSKSIQNQALDSILTIPLKPNSTYSISGLPITISVAIRYAGFIDVAGAYIAGYDFNVANSVSFKDAFTTPNQDCSLVISLQGRTASNNNFTLIQVEEAAIHTEFVNPYKGISGVFNLPFMAPDVPSKTNDPVGYDYFLKQLASKVTAQTGFGLYPDADKFTVQSIGTPEIKQGANLANQTKITNAKEVYYGTSGTIPVDRINTQSTDAIIEINGLIPSSNYTISGLAANSATKGYLILAADRTILEFGSYTGTSKTFLLPANAVTLISSLTGRIESAKVYTALMFNFGTAAQGFVPYQSTTVYNFAVNKLYNPIVVQTEALKPESPITKQYFDQQIALGVQVLTKGKNGLLFGDSITETLTAAAAVRDNWPNYAFPILQATFSNFARSSASFRDRTGLTDPRQIIWQQITDAISANGVVDFVVVAMGTNDGITLMGNYDTAMAKATLADLDRTNLFEAMRWAFWTIKTNWNVPLYVCTPLQRFGTEPTVLEPLYQGIKKMAARYNGIVIDCTYESGIVKDFEVSAAQGRDLSDGLHPSVTGRAKQGKLIASRILATYRP